MDKRMTRTEAVTNARVMGLDASAHLLKVAFNMTLLAALFWLAPNVLPMETQGQLLRVSTHVEELQWLSIMILYVVMMRAAIVFDKRKARAYVAKRGWQGNTTSLGMVLSMSVVSGLVGGMPLFDFIAHTVVVFCSLALVWAWRFFLVSNKKTLAQILVFLLAVIPIGLMGYMAVATGEVNVAIYGNDETGVLALSSLVISIVLTVVMTHSAFEAAKKRMGVSRSNGPIVLSDRWG